MNLLNKSLKLRGILVIISACLVLYCCQEHANPEDFKKWKAEIVAVEKAFNDMAREQGLAKAFEFFAAEDGVLRRRNKIVKGKTAIREWYDEDSRPGDTLSWKPTYVDVSESGDMAYTYGEFTFTFLDTLGNVKKNTGIFHSVWKRQEDGSWRYVWD